uniref:EGF like domain multiple 7 n=1 Tax=Canis lupus familiaris TaxID=9615 RepID=A0A8C0SQT9_CANLF
MMAPTRPWASCLFADSSLLSARNTHRKSGREGPIPILIYTGWSIKSRPSSPREEPPCPETAVHTAQMDAPVVRPGRWPLQAPRGGRTGGGSTSGLRRQQWGPGPSPGPGRIRPPGGEGRCTCRRGPCVTLGSCSCCGFWCWQWVALSTSSGLAAGCVPSGLPGALSLSLLCSECTSPSSPPVMVTGPAALTGPSTGQPTATALGRPPPGLAMPAALAGRGPAGTPWPVEQKLQLVLAPLHSMASRALEHGLPDPSSLLTHSFQQLDRIDSLSEQISFLEEQLGSCSCKKQP